MEPQEIKKKSISGAKYTVLLTLLTIPLTYGINIILGRISPEALGTYGLVLIFIAVITTFILFGGNTLVVKMLPEIEDDKKISFLLTYILLTLFVSIIFIILMLLFPNIFKLITQTELTPAVFKLFILFIPIVIIQQLVIYALNGIMEIKTSVILQKIIPVGNFIFTLSLFVFFREFIAKNYQILIWATYISLTLISAIIGLYLLNQKLKKKHYINKVKLFIPNNFWLFAIFVHISTILFFAHDKIGQLFILKYFSIRELGLYYAALQTAMIIQLGPMLMGRVLLPTFSNLFASNEIKLIQKGYREVVRYNTLVVIPIALMCIFFSRQIMGVFGEAYVQNHLVLAVFGMFYAFIPMGGVNYSLVVAKGRAGTALINSSIQVSFQFIVMLALINNYGILGLAIGKGASIVLAQIGLIFIVTKLLNIGIKIPKSYKIGIITAIIASILYFAIPTQNIIVLAVLFLGCLIFFMFFADYSRKDIDFIVKHLFARYQNKDY